MLGSLKLGVAVVFGAGALAALAPAAAEPGEPSVLLGAAGLEAGSPDPAWAVPREGAPSTTTPCERQAGPASGVRRFGDTALPVARCVLEPASLPQAALRRWCLSHSTATAIP